MTPALPCRWARRCWCRRRPRGCTLHQAMTSWMHSLRSILIDLILSKFALDLV
jgi:hypothetical protein